MPVDRGLAVDLTQGLSDLYGQAQTRLATHIAGQLSRGMAAPDWAQAKLGALGDLQGWTQTLIGRLNSAAGAQVEQAVVLAYARGGRSALADLRGHQLGQAERLALGNRVEAMDRLARLAAARSSALTAQLAEARLALPGVDAMQRLAFSLHGQLQGTHLRILRWGMDSYRTVIAETSAPGVLLGLDTRRRSAQRAWERLLSQGVTGFQDRAGRRWDLQSYVEMASRTTVAQAAVEGHLDRLGDADIDLVMVSDAPQECARCRPWEGKILARGGPGGARTIEREHATEDDHQVKVKVAGSLDEAIAAGLMHPNCFPGDVLVSAPSGVVAADARWYQGPLVVIHTASGDELPVTPNHPVLTPEGWVAAGQLAVGQHVLRHRGDVERAALGAPHDDQVPARISEVYDALRQASPVPPVRVPVAPEQFHGDGLGSDVHVVLADGLLRDGLRDQGSEREFLGGGVRSGALLASGSPLEVSPGPDHASHCGVRAGYLSGALFVGQGVPLPALGSAGIGAVAASEQGGADGRLGSPDGLGDGALGHSGEVKPDGLLGPGAVALRGDASLAELPVEGGDVDAHGGRDLVSALAGLVSADRVVEVEQRREWAGHVYNLQSRDGWYVASGIVVHNCRHSVRAYLPGVTKIPTDTEDPDGDKARQRLRVLERQVRQWKLREQAAIDPVAKKAAAAKVRAKQAMIAAHVKATPGLLRQRGREQVGVAR